MSSTVVTAPHEIEASSPSFAAVVWATTTRGLMRLRRLPSLLVPTIVMPVFFVIAFSGTFSAAVSVEGYGTDKAVNWMVAWAIVQGAAFSGVGAAGSAATDLENGFFDRLRLAPASQLALLAGLVLYAQIRAMIPTVLVLVVATVMGADYLGGVLGIVLVFAGAIGVSTITSLMALAMVFTLKTLRALAFVQILLFTLMFLSIGQAPLVAIEGWLHAVARVNPMTNIIRLIRQGFLGDVTWALTWPGLVAIAGLVAFFGLIAYIQLRRITD